MTPLPHNLLRPSAVWPVRQSLDRFLSLFTEIRNGEGMLGFRVWQYAAINIFFALIWIGIVTVITREHKKLSAPA